MTDPALIPSDVVRTVPEGQVVYGMQLPIQSQSTRYVDEWELGSGPAEMARIARVADEAGFFYLGVCDHTAIPRRLANAMGTIWYDTVATLGWLAAVTSRTHLLSHVLVLAQRHPLRAAKEFSTIDALSGGRVIVGVGAGHVPEEYELFTGGFDERGRHTDEAVSALARCLTDEFPDLPGPRFPAHDMGLGPRPVRRPRPPIWIGGSSRAAIRRTAAFGDGWLPQGTSRRDLPDQIALLRELRAELRDAAPIDIGTIVEPIHLTSGGSGWDLPSWVVSGGAEQVAASLRELVAMGVNHLQVRFMARSAEEFCDQTARFGVEVGPLLNP
ncbi:MAG TPA: TIGR03619 family F420-dependent LLM class oxidoreductase, partial [Acidimicrobiales bacterium]|nr:TIGR03619 family F420-dependent LLM class oxidoreductase [Acidimicrobiales bacterium]